MVRLPPAHRRGSGGRSGQPHAWSASAPGGGRGAGQGRAVRTAFSTQGVAHVHDALYIGNPDIKRQISRPPYLGDGPRALDLIRARCSIAQMQTDWQETKEKWLSITIAKDIGCSPSTIEDLELELDTVNQQLPVDEQFGENDKAVMILKSIATASRHFNYAAKREINAIEGVPGQPRVREFQQAPPGGGGPRLRDCAGIVSNYAGLWRDAVMSGTIPKAQPTSRRAPTRVETGMLLTGIDRPETIFSGVDGASYAPRGVDPQHTLDLIRDAIVAVEEHTETGLSLAVRRSDTTTTDFGAVPPADLQRAVELLNQGNVDPAQEFVLHQVFDAEGTPSWEISCRCCGGLGHIAKHCPSEKKFRSFDHIIKMATDSKERAEARGAERGHPPGGKRGMTQTRVPSTAKYSFFGQRFDSDLAVKLTRSWPHGFTAYIDYCDRHTAEVFYGFLQRPNGAEVASSTADLLERLKPRLQDGRVHRWHVDNDQAFGRQGDLRSHAKAPPQPGRGQGVQGDAYARFEACG